MNAAGQRRRQVHLLFQGIFLGLCICLLCFSLYKLGSIFFEYHSGEKEYDELRQYLLAEPISPEDPTLAQAEEGEESEESRDGEDSQGTCPSAVFDSSAALWGTYEE